MFLWVIISNTKSMKLMVFVVIILSTIFNSYGQVRVPFAPRTATASPSKTVYAIKGDFTMIGNTNLTLASYSDNGYNDDDMKYVDIDGDSNTWNSSSATLNFSTENGAIPSCSNIIYAGLYWTGRASDSGSSADIFTITKNSVGKDGKSTTTTEVDVFQLDLPKPVTLKNEGSNVISRTPTISSISPPSKVLLLVKS